MLPALGIVLPSGSTLKGGTVSANLAITGPLNNPSVTGPVKVSDTSLAGFNLGSKLGALSAFAGKAVSQPDTAIRNLSSNVHASSASTQLDDINLDVPAIGVITGTGTVSPGGALNFKMLANLHGGMAGGVTKVAAVGSGQNGIPFSVQGTASDPHFIPEIGGVAGNLAAGAVKGAVGGAAGTATAPAKAIGGLIKKKP